MYCASELHSHRAIMAESLVASCCDARVAHSQTTAIRQFASRNSRQTRRSRETLRVNFSAQKGRRVEGSLKYLHAWQCQKQPCTKTTALYLVNTMSGCPGSSAFFRLNRKPARCSALRTSRSGFVSCDRIPAIIRLRVGASTISVKLARVRRSTLGLRNQSRRPDPPAFQIGD